MSDVNHNIAIADAIVAELNSAELSMPIESERAYLPIIKLEDVSDKLVVHVVPAGDTETGFDRTRDKYDLVTQIGVMKRFPGQALPNNEMLDPLMVLVQEIRRHFRKRRLAAYLAAICLRTTAAYSDADLEQNNQFSALITLQHIVHA